MALNKRKSLEFELQDTGESPWDPLSQRAAHVGLKFFQWNINIYTKLDGLGPIDN